MKRIKTFNSFISEGDVDICPRCNEPFDQCECKETDYWSTYTYSRAPKGKEEKTEPKIKFKKD